MIKNDNKAFVFFMLWVLLLPLLDRLSLEASSKNKVAKEDVVHSFNDFEIDKKTAAKSNSKNEPEKKSVESSVNDSLKDEANKTNVNDEKVNDNKKDEKTEQKTAIEKKVKKTKVEAAVLPALSADPVALAGKVFGLAKSKKFKKVVKILASHEDVVETDAKLLKIYVEALINVKKVKWRKVYKFAKLLSRKKRKSSLANYAQALYFLNRKKPDTDKALKLLVKAKSAKKPYSGVSSLYYITLLKKYEIILAIIVLLPVIGVVVIIKKKKSKKNKSEFVELNLEDTSEKNSKNKKSSEEKGKIDLNKEQKSEEQSVDDNIDKNKPENTNEPEVLNKAAVDKQSDKISDNKQSESEKSDETAEKSKVVNSTVIADKQSNDKKTLQNFVDTPDIQSQTDASKTVQPSKIGVNSGSQSLPATENVPVSNDGVVLPNIGNNQSQTNLAATDTVVRNNVAAPVQTRAMPNNVAGGAQYYGSPVGYSGIPAAGTAGNQFINTVPGGSAGYQQVAPIDLASAKRLAEPMRQPPVQDSPELDETWNKLCKKALKKRIPKYARNKRDISPEYSPDNENGIAVENEADAKHNNDSVDFNVTIDLSEEALKDDLIVKLKMLAISDSELRTLFSQRNPAHIPHLIEYVLTRPEPLRLAFVARELGNYNDPAIIDTLASLLYHEDERVVLGAIQGLENTKSPNAILHICPFLKSDIPVLAQAARNALAKFGAIKILKAFINLPEHSDEKIKEAGIFVLSRMKGKQVEDLLIAMLEDDSENIKEKVILAMAYQKNPVYLEPLRKFFKTAEGKCKALARKSIVYLQGFVPKKS